MADKVIPVFYNKAEQSWYNVECIRVPILTPKDNVVFAVVSEETVKNGTGKIKGWFPINTFG